MLSGGMLRVATWNVELGRRLDLVLEGLARLPHLDLLALQELSVHDGRPDAEAIAERLGPGYRSAQFTAQRVKGAEQANGLVWDGGRLSLESLHSLGLPTPAGRVMRRLPETRRSALVAEGCAGALRLRLHVVHLDVLGVAHKQAQLERVLADAAARPAPDLALVLGDLNTYGLAGRPSWQRLRRLAAEAGFEELTAGVGWTHRALGVRQKLDAIFASPPGWRHRAWREPLPGSDHLPVLAELAAG